MRRQMSRVAWRKLFGAPSLPDLCRQRCPSKFLIYPHRPCRAGHPRLSVTSRKRVRMSRLKKRASRYHRPRRRLPHAVQHVLKPLQARLTVDLKGTTDQDCPRPSLTQRVTTMMTFCWFRLVDRSPLLKVTSPQRPTPTVGLSCVWPIVPGQHQQRRVAGPPELLRFLGRCRKRAQRSQKTDRQWKVMETSLMTRWPYRDGQKRGKRHSASGKGCYILYFV